MYACQVKLTGTLGYVASGLARLHGGTPSPVGCLAARRIRLTGSVKERSPNRCMNTAKPTTTYLLLVCLTLTKRRNPCSHPFLQNGL